MTHGGMRLADVAREVPGDVSVPGGASEILVTGVHHDSRAVGPGDLFVARRGASADGAGFATDAVRRGAVAIVAAQGAALPPLAVPVVRVDDPQRALAYAAAAVYGHPSFALDVVGVTGTNGKTTTTHLVRAALDGALGRPSCGTLGTVGHGFAGALVEATHTTPEADEVARVLAWMRTRGASTVAMEVSSHALAQGRVEAVRFRVAAFTNLTQDHLDFHGSFAAYGDAKARLFTELGPGAAVVNVDDPFGAELAERVTCPLLRVRRTPGADADVAPTTLDLGPQGVQMRARTPFGEVEVRSRLLGLHNVENLLVALAIALALDVDPADAARALGEEGGAPGRLERCDEDADDVRVLVDYAHTPDALARALDSLAPFRVGRVICVFGCGGDRDPTKRAPMGSAAGRGADLAVVTSDNPRGEAPEAIAEAVEVGVRAAGLTRIALSELAEAPRGYVVVLDRREAIAAAVHAARPGDIVLICGKGHENYQIVGAVRHDLDDRVEARRALAARRGT
ncbi:MAG: UDP-N-acetylmuramoyl-L-alanyl-D-glutamate--2,6-diaminopimelate ligase [Myxococcales bacterium]|nr:UDP-N-acetylmuramoyl-L-alanyl-D-glutamate--2,6-diaminopimelate ligase [Myxococcales bacterium]MBL0198416.1 UDP-N-acetylmuramoyl-L-alanyl-D-glutamate--2,6-diaminopimelate ligase [Myxococcales bacterium]HQY60890.1 UDP-N-acetylmuramoyl-L-alanyl-D-glutamate--2,6-diaminopimelate ligase [Polyangiaceae bacterium]